MVNRGTHKPDNVRTTDQLTGDGKSLDRHCDCNLNEYEMTVLFTTADEKALYFYTSNGQGRLEVERPRQLGTEIQQKL